jgi:hypothetical protein
MFYDREDCTIVADGIYLFKNYLSKDRVDSVSKKLSTITKKDQFDYKDSLIDWYMDKMTPPLLELFPVWEDISEIIYPEYVAHPQRFAIVTRPEDKGMFVHADNPGTGEEDLTQKDPWSTCALIDYGMVAYFGEFEGGETYYPKFRKDGSLREEEGPGDINDCLEIKPEAGDVIIHRAVMPWSHGVRNVTSGVRYAFSNFVMKSVNNPGSFYNYKSPEYMEQIGNKTASKDYSQLREKDLASWQVPLRNNDYEEEIVKKVNSDRDHFQPKFYDGDIFDYHKNSK